MKTDEARDFDEGMATRNQTSPDQRSIRSLIINYCLFTFVLVCLLQLAAVNGKYSSSILLRIRKQGTSEFL